jgi:hypothetical protein
MNLLISLHFIFQDEDILGWEEEVEAMGLEEDLDGGGQDSEKEEGARGGGGGARGGGGRTQ